ncbi:hypothetical protein L484_019425 [Morus notabilis]|uniref:Protein LTV1-like protein n=2 Tax=Morus notabilis TaxID=981085 RepID=W9RQV0_9ROSA|nr:hypothetical protein L484_019425 [Morus notabilis]
MGKKKKFIDKKKSATFQLLARDSSAPNYDGSPGSDRVFVRVDNNHYSTDTFFAGDGHDNAEDPDSIFADAPDDYDVGEDDNCAFGSSSRSAAQPLPEHVRKEILELGLPDDGYNYLLHLRESKNIGGGSAFYRNPKTRLDLVPSDVKAYDASRLRISDAKDDANEIYMYSVAAETVGVRIQRAVDPEIAALLVDNEASRFGSDVEDLEEDFVIQANFRGDNENVSTDKGSSLCEKFESKEVICEDHTFRQPQNVSGLSSQDGVGSHVTEAKDDSFTEKPRVRRLLDEQFDLLESQEYGSDHDDVDDYGYIAEEDESLAEKLKHALNDETINDFELDDKYKVPADLIHADDKPKRTELVDSARDLIRRCMEYAEKYENDDRNQDMVIVEESSDESEVWDCETIVSTYSNLDNQPGKIKAPEATRKKKLAEAMSGALKASNPMIALKGREKLPVDFLLGGRKPTVEKARSADNLRTEQQKRKQHGQESKEEKQERKAALKEEKHEARRVKKEMKGLYRGEAQRAQRVAATSGPSSIHLM